MLNSERQRARRRQHRQHWSPELQRIGKTFSYRRQKATMAKKKIFLWDHLNRLRSNTDITDDEHATTNFNHIITSQRKCRAQWQACKKKSFLLRKQFLQERAELMAEKMRTLEEKAVKAILKSEESRLTFKTIKELLGRSNTPLTSVEVLSDPLNTTSPLQTVSNKDDVHRIPNTEQKPKTLFTSYINPLPEQ